MQTYRVTVLTGGPTLELKSSLDSALGVLDYREALKDLFQLEPCFITSDGIFLDRPTSEQVLDKWRSGDIKSRQEEIDQIARTGHVEAWQIISQSSIVFPAICGALEEDGIIIGLCRALRVPCVGSSILDNVVQYDKVICNAIFAQAGVPQTPQMIILPDEDPPNATAISETMPLPWFIKPSSAGCSIGISQISTTSDLLAAIHRSRFYYPHEPILLEVAVKDALEVDVMVMRDGFGTLQVTPCGLFISPPSGNDVETNPTDLTASPNHVPAPGVPPADAQKMQAMAQRVYRLLRVSGFLKVDFFYIPSSGEILVNEVSTIVNMSSGSMVFQLWTAAGIAPADLIRRLLQDALDDGSDEAGWEHAARMQKSLVGRGRSRVD